MRIPLDPPEFFVAIDWSGAATSAGQRKGIAVASWQCGELRLRTGFTREEVANWLIAQGEGTPRLVVGLDFAFSFPAWWVRAQGCASVSELWSLATRQGEQWLCASTAPFWGRPAKPRPAEHGAPGWLGFRYADRALRIRDCPIRPKSPFQIGGAGAVGTGSVRGMPLLARLHECGFHVWPFHPPALPLVLEIYPRLFTGAVVKSDRQARAAYLEAERFFSIPTSVRESAVDSEDAFDALCSVLGMVEGASKLANLATPDHEDALLEGAIWHPGLHVTSL